MSTVAASDSEEGRHRQVAPSRRLLGYVLRYRHAFFFGVLCGLTTTAIGLASPWVLKYAIDGLYGGKPTSEIRFYAAALLGLATGGGIFRFLMRRLIIGASRNIECDLRNDFFAHLQRLDIAYYQRHRTGDLMARATNDLGAVREMVGPAVMYAVNTALTFVVALLLMLSIDLRLTLLALMPLPLVYVSMRYFGAAIYRRFELLQEQWSEISAMTHENLTGVRVVRAYGQEPFEIERFRQANAEYLRRNRRLINLQGIFNPSTGFAMGTSALLALWLGSRDVVAGRMTIGELVAFNGYLLMLSWPITAFGWVANMVQRGLASWTRMIEVFEATAGNTVRVESDGRASAPTAGGAHVNGDVEFRRVTFAFGDRVVLQDVSVTVRAGTTTAIVGATGAGKSTLLNLLPRLHEPPAGTVFVDGVDVRHVPLAALRGAIAFVPQEPFLFGGSVADNVAFGLDGGRDARERIEQAARTACLDKDVADFPKGYDTIVGERGITLSGGQKQRTAIARALAIDAPILVLDDALSAVDTDTEEQILARLAAARRNRTTIIVSHRVSTVRGADQILVLSEGLVAERGTHDELIAHNGQYADLHRKQLLEEELAAS